MNIKFWIVMIAMIPTLCWGENVSAADPMEAMRKAGEKMSDVKMQAETLAVQGRYEEGNKLILAVFPKDRATAIEQLVTANVLFRQSPAESYALHKLAAAALPTFSSAQLEWALEQHRAKEYAGAAKTYEAFSKLKPNYAPAYGLAAECALRLGDTAKAIDLWTKSEKASSGTLEDFESLVCEVNGSIPNDRTRAELLTKARQGNAAAATDLILMDAAFKTDWWNEGPNIDRLKNDLAVIKGVFTTPDLNVIAAICVADVTLGTDSSEPVPLAPRLKKAGLFLGDKFALPDNGKAASHLLQLIITNKVLTEEEARNRYSERMLGLARQHKDAEMYNAAAYLNLGTDKLSEIDLEAWNSTGDSRFACSYLAGQIGLHQLTLDDPLFVRAIKEFPGNGVIAGFAVRLAAEKKISLNQYLVAAIKAEYTKFSTDRPGVDFPRPSAYVLQNYFAELAKLQPQKPNQNKIMWSPKA